MKEAAEENIYTKERGINKELTLLNKLDFCTNKVNAARNPCILKVFSEPRFRN
jgi:hypothetical protein